MALTPEHAKRVIHALANMKRSNMTAMGQLAAETGQRIIVDPQDSDMEVLMALETAEYALDLQLAPKKKWWKLDKNKSL